MKLFKTHVKSTATTKLGAPLAVDPSKIATGAICMLAGSVDGSPVLGLYKVRNSKKYGKYFQPVSAAGAGKDCVFTSGDLSKLSITPMCSNDVLKAIGAYAQ